MRKFVYISVVAALVGTGEYKPDNSWAIHPVTSIAPAP